MKKITFLLIIILMSYFVLNQFLISGNLEQNKNEEKMNGLQTATFGAGCFWGVELKFSKLKGVVSTKVGYMGGKLDNPSYQDVCYNKTGHAEVVQVEFNPSEISFEELVNAFFTFHDPTQLNRQGPDVGDQYRSSIFFQNEEQKNSSIKIIEQLNKSKFNNEIVTKLEKADTFWLAEEYHQKYLQKRGYNSCSY